MTSRDGSVFHRHNSAQNLYVKQEGPFIEDYAPASYGVRSPARVASSKDEKWIGRDVTSNRAHLRRRHSNNLVAVRVRVRPREGRARDM